MKLIRTEDAVGQVLCHDITQIIPGQFKGARFRKGHIVQPEDIPVLLSIGKENLYVWEKRPGILHEDEAAALLYKAAAGRNIHGTEPKEGKIELVADCDGLLKIDRAALLAVPLMVVYALAVGCTPSVLRAVVMHTLLLLGAILGRETDPPTSLSFALMLLLLQNPYAARSVSLQLSFASVAGIAAFSGRVHDWLWGGFRFPKEKKRLRRLPDALCHGAVTSLAP